MPLIISLPKENRSIELEEFIALIEDNKLNLNDREDLINSAQYLNLLNNNKRFLISHLVDELSNGAGFQKSNVHNSSVFHLHHSTDYLLRAVIWHPVSDALKANKNFNYDVYHDHNFDLLTIGYFGPGYKTRSFTYNENEVIGFLGEDVKMEDNGILTLAEGQIMLYESKKDIHNQIPPDSISVSLNIIPKKNIINRPQYEFDESKSKICRYIQISSNELVVRLASMLGQENDIPILERVMLGNDNPHIQAYAALSIAKICSTSNNEIEKWVNNSKNSLIMDIFKREKLEYGSCI